VKHVLLRALSKTLDEEEVLQPEELLEK